jgi:hypothetical protein
MKFFCRQIRGSFPDDGERFILNFYHMAKHILDYMPREALEKDENGL